MKNLLKWLLIIGGIFLVLIIAAVIIIPQFVDVQKYKPVIEQKVAEATGRSFTLGDEIDISVFPWVGVKLTDLHFGNGKGYKQKDNRHCTSKAQLLSYYCEYKIGSIFRQVTVF